MQPRVPVAPREENSVLDTSLDEVYFALQLLESFPGGSVVKNLPANAGVMGSVPGLGRFHMRQNH